MADVVVVAQIKAKPGQAEALERALRAAVAPTHQEDGCIRYALHRSIEDKDTFFFLERWRSQQDLDQHLERSHIRTLFAKLDELTAGDSSLSVLEPLPEGQPEKGEI